MDLSGYHVGYGITGSFCTFERSKEALRRLREAGAEVTPIFSYQAQKEDTRFGRAADFVREVEEIAGRRGIYTISEAEPIGPRGNLDLVILAPCTGNTAAKLAAGIVDTPVLMAAKAHLRNGKPLVIAISTNDALGMNFKTIGALMNMKNIFFVPMRQDDPIKKPNSLVADLKRLPPTVVAAREGRQIQPVLLGPADEC